MSAYAFDPSKLMKWATIKERLAAINATVPADVLAATPPSLAIIVSCGAFNPITTAHVRMLETAKRYLDGKLADDEVPLYGTGEGSTLPTMSTTTIAVGGFVSPVSDKYGKADLAPFAHRKAVCDLVLKEKDWVTVEDWEGLQPQYERTFTVLSHIRREVRNYYATTATTDEERRLASNAECFFLCGGDLFETFYRSGVWELTLLEKIFREFKLLVIARVGSRDPYDTIAAQMEPLTHPSTPDASLDLRLYRERVHVLRIPENTTSSTRVRDGLRAKTGIDELVGEAAAKYLRDNNVYV